MATTPQAQVKPKAERVPGEASGFALMVLLAAWAVPGAGHLLLGKWVRALLLFAAILGMYLIGMGLQGKIYSPNTGEILDILGFAGQLGMGLLYVLARLFGWGASAVLNTLADYGTKFLVVAGLLNIIAAVDAYSLANGRKAS
jgi:hypothetical protein